MSRHDNQDVLSREIIPVEALEPMFEQWREGNGKALSIIRATSAVISTISSSLLIWMLARSTKRFTTTQHRILLGMSIFDIIMSLSYAHFNAMAPSEMSYIVWNAHGNEVSCAVVGYFSLIGLIGVLLYQCSLNVYYLLVIKFGKTDRYIRMKAEPFLHGVPILVTLIFTLPQIPYKNFNSNTDGACIWPSYEPPHCIGYEFMEVREGFSIPCGRGRDSPEVFSYLSTIFFLGTPIFIGVILGVMYVHVRKQEKRMARFGVGSLNLNEGANGSTEANDNSICSRIRKWFTKKRSSSPEQSNSRGVLQQAAAFSCAYFLTWGWFIIYRFVEHAGADVPLWLEYMVNIFSTLQGFFNLIVFIYPKVVKAKRSQDGDLSWYQAIGKVFHPKGEWEKKKKRPTLPVSEEASHTGSMQNENCVELETGGINEEDINKE